MDNQLKNLWDLLEKHDWYYTYSDDHRYYVKGSKERKVLQSMVQENERLMKLYKDYADYVFNGKEKPNIDDEL